MQPIELLSPARDADTAIAAIDHGADAVYIGAPSHGARAAAGNSVADIRRVCDYAHRFDARVYVTLNTLIYDHELADVEALVWQLYRAGVDALIVQDMGLLRLNLPPIALHASTQCDTRDASRALMLARAGFSQIVLARELTVNEIAAIHRAGPDVALEAFVHGALCVCFSGDCRASLLTSGRSANRGECAQVCRYSFDLVDGDGRTLVRDKHLLSLRDMNRSALLSDMLEAGVSSLKIEGRLKDTAYVKNVTAHYRRLLDDIIAAAPERYCRASAGEVALNFAPDASRSFNRGFTPYFADTDGSREAIRGLKMASIDTPKARGQRVATVAGRRGKALVVKASVELHNGDGLGYFDGEGRFKGFRVNRVEGALVYPASPVDAAVGTALYRNADKAWADTLAGPTARRTIDVSFTLRRAGAQLVLDAADCRGMRIAVTEPLPAEVSEARTPQLDQRRRTLEKTGDTIYRVRAVDDRAGSLFVPLSLLAGLRRKALDALDSARRATWHFDSRRPEDAQMRVNEHITYHENVANEAARRFYADHGALTIDPAAETVPQPERPSHAMTTRYCLRRELGRCLLTPEGREWKEPLQLRSPGAVFDVTFDCRRCLMSLHTANRRGK